ncbi:MAG: hypothetical protein QOH88_3379 [Verrucomicrobiota bacterium]|jgi:hypothetical protein
MAKSIVQKIQDILGVESDDVWGPGSQTALNAEIKKTSGKGNPKLMKIQKLLGVGDDGFWGPVSQGALNEELGGSDGFTATASSFADPADVVAFKKCKAQGKSDNECFKVGDNGIGQFGKITAQNQTAMVAIHSSDMIARWGSVNAAAHRLVTVTINGKTIQASVEDRLGVAGRIDLNPAAAKQLGLNPPFLVKNCTWNWV